MAVLYTQSFACVFSWSVAIVNELLMKSGRKWFWNHPSRVQILTATASHGLQEGWAKERYDGYATLHGLVDPLLSTLAMQGAPGMFMESPCMKVPKLHELEISTFHSKESQHQKNNQKLWSPI